MRLRRAGVVLAVALATACGSTVPITQHAGMASEPAGAGLGTAAPLAAAEPAATTPTGAPLGTSGGSAPGAAPAAGPGAPAAQPQSPSGAAGAPGPAQPGPDGAASGSARRTGPLKVGVAYTDNAQAQGALGVSSDQTANERTAVRAMVRGLNDAGGVAGRKIEAVEYAWDSSGNNWSENAAVACERFTRDEPVTVVLDAAFGTIGGFGDCLHKAGVLHITNSSEGDRVSSQQRPLHANTGSMIDDRTYGAVLSRLAATGYLTPRSQLGVVLEQCPAIERAYTRSIKPLIARLGMPAPVERAIECTTGFSSAGPAGSVVSGAVLAFRQADVDRVMFVSDQESVALLLFANNASPQQYFPGYALSSNAQAEPLRPNLPADQWPQLHGVGTSPYTDVADDGSDPAGVEARCVRLSRRGGVTAQAHVDYAFIHGACGLFLLLEAGLERTGGNAEAAALQAAINGLGTSFRGPGLVANATRYSADAHDGPDAVQVFGYEQKCTCVRYRGKPLPAPR